MTVEKYFDRIRFNKVQHSGGRWYDWMSEEVSVPFLENKVLRINLEFDDSELDVFQAEISLTLQNALRSDGDRRQVVKPHLFAYYQDVLNVVGEYQIEEMPLLETEEDIFDYVDLKRMSIGRGIRNGKFYANFCGNCKWDEEHGVSISFELGEQLAMVSSVSHICNSDAYGGEDKDRYIYVGSFIQTTRSDVL